MFSRMLRVFLHKAGVDMEQYAINGGNPLVGEVEIGGAKNAALPILAASLMTDETVLVENIPDVRHRRARGTARQALGENQRFPHPRSHCGRGFGEENQGVLLLSGRSFGQVQEGDGGSARRLRYWLQGYRPAHQGI